jgi:hypothetical protein
VQLAIAMETPTIRRKARRTSVLTTFLAGVVLALAHANVSEAKGICVPGLLAGGCAAPPQAPPPADLPSGGSNGEASRTTIPQRDFVGIVSEDAFAGNGDYRAKTFPLYQGVGIGTIRQSFIWSDIERRKGRFNFGYIDGFVADAARHGVTILPVLFGAPDFRSSKPRRSALRGAYPPRRPSDIAPFARAAAQRYGPGGSFWKSNRSVPRRPVRAWQIWNEPNLPIYWRPAPNAREFVRMLSAASRAIKRVDKGAEVVTAGLPQSQSKGAVPLQAYIAAMYRAGGNPAFDTLAVNPYGATSGEVLKRVEAVRKTMNGFGDQEASLWITELGWADSGPSSRFTVGARQQAARIRSLIGELWDRRSRLGLRGFVYYNWRDAPPYAGRNDFWGLHTGLLDIDGQTKPAYEAFRSAVRELR